MDQELISYFDQRFTAIDRSFTAIDQRFTDLEQHVREEIERLREETKQRFEQVEDKIHLTQVTIEGVHHKIGIIAEGLVGFNERQESFRTEVAKDLDRRLQILEIRKKNEGRDPLDIIREKLANGSF